MSAEYKCFLLVRCAILLRRHYAWSLDSSIIISIFPVLLNTALLGKCWGSVKYSLPVLVSNLTIFNINLLGIFLILSLLSLNMKKKSEGNSFRYNFPHICTSCKKHNRGYFYFPVKKGLPRPPPRGSTNPVLRNLASLSHSSWSFYSSIKGGVGHPDPCLFLRGSRYSWS